MKFTWKASYSGFFFFIWILFYIYIYILAFHIYWHFQTHTFPGINSTPAWHNKSTSNKASFTLTDLLPFSHFFPSSYIPPLPLLSPVSWTISFLIFNMFWLTPGSRSILSCCCWVELFFFMIRASLPDIKFLTSNFHPALGWTRTHTETQRHRQTHTHTETQTHTQTQYSPWANKPNGIADCL